MTLSFFHMPHKYKKESRPLNYVTLKITKPINQVCPNFFGLQATFKTTTSKWSACINKC